MKQNIKEEGIPSTINLSKISMNGEDEINLTKDTEWVKEILMELNEKATDRTPQMYLMKSFLDIELKIKKCHRGKLGEFILIRGKINCEFMTSCIRTLHEMKDYLKLDFNACFIDKNFENEPEYKDVLEVYEDNCLFDLYFFEGRQIDLKELIQEIIYLNINQYPVSDPDTPLFSSIDPKMPKN